MKTEYVTNIPVQFYSANRQIAQTKLRSSNFITINELMSGLIGTFNQKDQFENEHILSALPRPLFK